MTPLSALVSALLSLLLFVVLFGMIRAWVWAIRRVRQGESLLPPPTAHRVPWGLGSVVLVMVAWLAINAGVAWTYLKITGGVPAVAPGAGKATPRPGPRPLEFTEQMFLVSVINGILLLLVPAALRLTSRARLADLGIRREGMLRDARVGLVAFLLISPVVYAFNGLAVLVWRPNAHPLEKMVRTDASEGIAHLAILSAVLLAPAAEELIFRGVIQGWLSQVFRRPEAGSPELADVLDLVEAPMPPVDATDVDPPPAVLDAPVWPPPKTSDQLRLQMLPIFLTSALFAVVHLPQWPAPLAIFLLSLGLGAVYQRSGSLVTSFVMHALFNGFGTLLLFGTLAASRSAAEKPTPPKACVNMAAPLGAFSRRP